MKHIGNQSGVTLVEILVVVAIMALIFALIVPRVVQAFNDVKDRVHEMTVRKLNDAAQLHLVFDGSDVVWSAHPGTKATDDYPAHDSWMAYLASWPQLYRGQGYVVEISGGKVTVTP